LTPLYQEQFEKTGRGDLMRLGSFMLLAGFILAACVHAGTTKLVEPETCSSVETQLELTACWAHVAKEAETKVLERFNEATKALIDAGDQESLVLFRKAQEQWERYRDLHCKGARLLYGNGSASPMIESMCRERMARDRLREIESIYIEWSKR
jgi:uncharacterized protein YecT (DUF1311 family)